jgi:hypothetical protein
MRSHKSRTTPLIQVPVRLTQEELLEYRSTAIEEGKSLSAFLRDLMQAYLRQRQRRAHKRS